MFQRLREVSAIGFLAVAAAVLASGCVAGTEEEGDDDSEAMVIDGPELQEMKLLPPIGTEADVTLSCSYMNGMRMPGPFILDDQGQVCQTYYVLSNCRSRPGGGCACDGTASAPEGPGCH